MLMCYCFGKLLKPIISKNKTKVKLKVSALKHDQYSLVGKGMDDKDLKIDKLINGNTDINSTHDGDLDSLVKLIQERDNGGLAHLAIETEMSGREEKKILQDLKCKSITTIELKNHDCYGRDLDFVNPLFEWKMIAQKQIFVIIHVSGSYWLFDNDKIISLFKQLYQNVYQLFVHKLHLILKLHVEE